MPSPFPSVDVRQAEGYPLYGPPLQVRWISNLYRLLVKEAVDQERAAKGEPPIHEAEIARLRQCDLHPTAGQYYLDDRIHEPAVEERLQRNARRIVDEYLADNPERRGVSPTSNAGRGAMSDEEGQGGSPLSSQLPASALPATTTLEEPAPSVCHAQGSGPPAQQQPNSEDRRAGVGSENDSDNQNQPGNEDESQNTNPEPQVLNSGEAAPEAAEYDLAWEKLANSTDSLAKLAELLDTATRFHRIAIDEFDEAADHFRYAKALRREANEFLRRTKKQFRRATRVHRVMVTRHRRATVIYRAAKKARDESTPAVPPFTDWHVNPPFPAFYAHDLRDRAPSRAVHAVPEALSAVERSPSDPTERTELNGNQTGAMHSPSPRPAATPKRTSPISATSPLNQVLTAPSQEPRSLTPNPACGEPGRTERSRMEPRTLNSVDDPERSRREQPRTGQTPQPIIRPPP